MPELNCPECHASVNPDLVDDKGALECPFCGHGWSLLELPQSQCAPAISDAALDDFYGGTGTTSTKKVPEPPRGSAIKTVEATEDRLVLYVGPGGVQAKGLGCFAALWLGFMTIFTPPWFIGLAQGNANNGPSMLGLVAFLALFWTIGLALGWFWMKMKYERTFLRVERDRIVVQKVLFNRKRIDETYLTPDSRAALVESYKQNDDPVYRIEVPCTNRTAKFGTALGDKEKDWLVDRINDFLGREGVWATSSRPTAEERAQAIAALPTSCKQCGALLTGELVKGALTCPHCGAVFRAAVTRPPGELPVAPVEQLVPADLPAQSLLLINEDSPDVLQMHYLFSTTSPARWSIPIAALPVSLVWCFIVACFLSGTWQAPNIFIRTVGITVSTLFLLVGLVPFAIGLVMLRGRTTIRLTFDTLECRWHAGWMGYRQSLPTEAIDEIRVQNFDLSKQNPRIRNPRQPKPPPEWKVCTARAAGKNLYLSLFLDEVSAGQMAALLKTRIADMGYVLPHV